MSGSDKMIAILARKIRRLEAKNRELQAEVDLATMIAHDIGAPAIIAYIKNNYPAIAKKWEVA